MKATFNDAVTVINRLSELGHTAYLAGGCVRDRILGIEPNDYDITTSATPEEVIAGFDKTVPVGISFGVVKVIIDGKELDVATFRTDGAYTDARRPDTVSYTLSAEEDVKRRDFTINALLMDVNGNVIDYVGGQEDLKNKILRAVGIPNERFGEDALRMMRAVRFSIKFDLTIEPATWDAIILNGAKIREISKERVTEELTKIFSYGRCDRAYLLLLQTELWERWFSLNISNKTINTFRQLREVQPGDPFILVLEIAIYNEYYPDRAQYKSKLALTNKQKCDAEFLHNNIATVRNFLNEPFISQRKIMQWENLDLIIKMIKYKGNDYYPSLTKDKEYVLAKMKEIKDLGWPEPLITGNDLLEMGFIQGPVFTKMLTVVRDEQLDNKLLDKDKVKAYLCKLFPAAPIKLPDGSISDDTRFRHMMADCSKCKMKMVISVPKSEEGEYIWSKFLKVVNISRLMNCYFFCDSCNGKKKKSSFKEVVI